MSAGSSPQEWSPPSTWPPLREELRGIEPYGAPQLDVPVQLNVNENPYGPSPEAAADIVLAIERSLADPRTRTRDLGGSADTAACGDAVAAMLG